MPVVWHQEKILCFSYFLKEKQLDVTFWWRKRNHLHNWTSVPYPAKTPKHIENRSRFMKSLILKSVSLAVGPIWAQLGPSLHIHPPCNMLLLINCFSHVQLFVTWTIACQALLSMGFSRQEYWSELPCLPPGNLPNPGIEPTSPVSPALQADSLPTEPSGTLLWNGV